MVGLSIVLEGYHQKHQVINKASTMIIKPPLPLPLPLPHSPSSYNNFQYPVFLQQCFLCKQTLLPGKDIYMYKGDRGFCSVECRCRQIFMDEEDSSNKDNCSFSAIKHKSTSSSDSSSSSSSASRHHRKGKNRPGGGFVC